MHEMHEEVPFDAAPLFYEAEYTDEQRNYVLYYI